MKSKWKLTDVLLLPLVGLMWAAYFVWRGISKLLKWER